MSRLFEKRENAIVFDGTAPDEWFRAEVDDGGVIVASCCDPILTPGHARMLAQWLVRAASRIDRAKRKELAKAKAAAAGTEG